MGQTQLLRAQAGAEKRGTPRKAMSLSEGSFVCLKIKDATINTHPVLRLKKGQPTECRLA